MVVSSMMNHLSDADFPRRPVQPGNTLVRRHFGVAPKERRTGPEAGPDREERRQRSTDRDGLSW